MFNFAPFQRAWLDALKSGKYKQGFCLLASLDINDDVSYCCLGVACEIAQNFPDIIKPHREVSYDGRNVVFDSKDDFLSQNMVSNLGLVDSTGQLKVPKLIGGRIYYSLALMNDNGMTHAQIAEYIENNPTNVFV